MNIYKYAGAWFRSKEEDEEGRGESLGVACRGRGKGEGEVEGDDRSLAGPQIITDTGSQIDLTNLLTVHINPSTIRP